MTDVETKFYPVDMPQRQGWYGTAYGWEIHIEGTFGEAHFWDGETWLEQEGGPKSDLPIIAFTEHPFASRAEAQAYADQHFCW